MIESVRIAVTVASLECDDCGAIILMSMLDLGLFVLGWLCCVCVLEWLLLFWLLRLVIVELMLVIADFMMKLMKFACILRVCIQDILCQGYNSNANW